MNDGQSSQHQPISFSREMWRKATHTGALIIPVGYSVLALDKVVMLTIMGSAALAVTIMDISRLRSWPLYTRFARFFMAPLLREHEILGDFSGAMYILWSTVFTVALYRRDIAVAALAFIVVGDTLAALVGRKFGRHRFGRKSLEGSLACLAGTLGVALVVPGLSLSVAVLGAVVAAVVEAFSGPIDDNVSVPLVSGLTMFLLEKIA